jgi:hypothetical protein
MLKGYTPVTPVVTARTAAKQVTLNGGHFWGHFSPERPPRDQQTSCKEGVAGMVGNLDGR